MTTVAVGTKLGAYEIIALIGAGGMGEVYRARDSRLGRDVALKVLPGASSADPDRLARFEQEARAAAALNHPNILAVYDIGQHETAPFIVSELLEGDTLRERLSAGGLPARKAIEYAIQLARGLAAAHDKGIVHRDLKPENVFITGDGRVKILDFGLAKLTETAAPASLSEVATKSGTHPGMVLGTIGYMAPEQVRGQPADHRSDIFAFGVVLYEMLAGRRAFQRDTTIDTMTAILKEDPPDLPAGDRSIPAALERIVDRCLEKTPGGRFQSTGDLAFALEALSSHSGTTPALTTAIPEPSPTRKRDRLAWALVGLLAMAALALGATLYFRQAPDNAEATRFVVLPPEGWNLAAQLQGVLSAGPLAVSPDGRQVAFVAQNATGGTLIWVRSLDTLAAKGLAGTEGGASPFWSPDSRSLGFFAGEKLKRIDVSGGPPITLCDASPGISGTWSPDGVIVFSPAGGTVLQRVSAAGGVPTAATAFQGEETAHARPAFLPDGRHFVYRAIPTLQSPQGPVFVGSLDSTEGTKLMDTVDSTNVVYSRGHLLFLRETTLMAQPFDPERLVVAGAPFPVAEQIQVFASYGFFSASDSGVLTYQTGMVAGNAPQLAWLDRSGKVLETIGKPSMYGELALAPDGRRAMVSLLGGQGQGPGDLWLLDLERDGLASRFTFDPANGSPLWSPAGERVVFSSARKGNNDLYQKMSNGAGNDEPLLITNEDKAATSWSADGQHLLYTRLQAPSDIWVLPMRGDGKPFPFLQTPAGEFQGKFSPDGRWVAYSSNESGRPEVYVTRFDGSGPASGGKFQVSSAGGNQPRWRPDGKEIFYLSPPPDLRVMATNVSAEGEAFKVGVVAPLFRVRPPGTTGSPYEVAPDGNRFLVNMAPDAQLTQTPITVVVNWTAGLKK